MAGVPWPALADAKESASNLADFMTAFDRITRDEGDALPHYERMRTLYRGMEGMEKRQAAQLLSMADAMYGRYQDAERHYMDAFPNSREPLSCTVSNASAEPALIALRDLPKDTRAVLINESHSLLATRAFIDRLLPVLRGLGFDHLALEALAPSEDGTTKAVGTPADAGLASRGYPLDRSAFGPYLREPLYAEIVRQALSLGFTLVAYESGRVGSKDVREQDQADALASLLASKPESKIAVIAGYSHIWKEDGWMASRLETKMRGRMVSIDQVSGLSGCAGAAPRRNLDPYVLTSDDGAMWSSAPGKVDITVLHALRKDGRTAPFGWLALGGRRHGVPPDTSACSKRWPCLVSAYYPHESAESVPADRVLLDGASDDAMLFLRPGRYRYVVRSDAGVRESGLVVP